MYAKPKWRRLGVGWIMTVVGLYLLLALPAVAHGLSARLPVISTPGPLSPVTMLIILDGDNRRGRVRAAQSIINSEQPAQVWVLGNRWILNALSEAGIDQKSFQLDRSATNTLEQMQQVARLTASTNGKVFVIASRLQAPRVAALAAAMATPVIVVPAPVDDEPPTMGVAIYLPSHIALRVSRDALYEHAALLWYARKGWIKTAPQATAR